MSRRTGVARVLGVMSTIAALACGDERTTSPVGITPRVESRMQRSSEKKGSRDTTSTTVVVTPDKLATIKISGGHFVVIPAGAICNVSTSGYGPDVWETPCELQQERVTVTARSWVSSTGRPQVQLSPDLRFAPDYSKLVWLVVQDSTAAQDTSSRIAFCPTPDGECVDESVADRDVDTRFEGKTGQLYRRLKHFGGYRVVAREVSVVQ